MKKKKAYLIIVIVILLEILLGFIYMYVQRKNTVAQIKKVVLNCTQNKVDARFINNSAGEKIYSTIQNNWSEAGGIKLKKMECDIENENWGKNYICVVVRYKGTLKNGKNAEDCEYYKVHFEKNSNGIYIDKVGVSVGEKGIYIY